MLERDRNRDGMLDPHEIEKRAGQVPHTGPQSLSHSEPAELGQLRLTQYFPVRSCADGLGRVLIDAQIGGPLSGQTGKPLPVRALPVLTGSGHHC